MPTRGKRLVVMRAIGNGQRMPAAEKGADGGRRPGAESLSQVPDGGLAEAVGGVTTSGDLHGPFAMMPKSCTNLH